ncbi:MAG: TetR/AcrR family transcriptional regulator [Desulfobacterales bacterium]|nr:TetR/AcrR family transcriptional regulator [Desulfobacterales bacterium]MCP4158512.1 TetR/AcrR family transcriptional regulator [Deltaproteobacteria bacterium]
MNGISKKQQILDAAEKVMGKKGMDARISEIAKLADINQSVLYHYYKNKEDLLFSVAEEHLVKMRNELEDQLFGIKDPESKLRKLLWFRISYLDKNRDYGELYLFECRSNLNFYKHAAFNRTLWFMAKLSEIIKEGIKSGAFKKDINIWLVRDTLFGLIDLMNIDSLITGEEISNGNYEQVTSLVLSMVIKQDKIKTKEDKKLKIIAAAEKIFAKYGYEKAKIQDIASAAGVADGTVYDYFKNKEDLLFSTLGDGFKPSPLKKGFQNHLSLSIKESDEKSTIDKLEKFIRNHFLMCLTQPSLVKILTLHGIYNRKFYDSDVFLTFQKYIQTIYPILEQAKDEGLIKKDIDSRIFIKMIIGAFSHITLRWQISESSVTLDKVGEINQMVNILINSISIA